jgi:hypothetical protein
MASRVLIPSKALEDTVKSHKNASSNAPEKRRGKEAWAAATHQKWVIIICACTASIIMTSIVLIMKWMLITDHVLPSTIYETKSTTAHQSESTYI